MADKRKTRLNIVDFLLIALLILAVVAVFMRSKVIEQIGKLSSNDTVIVSFAADHITEETLEQMQEGDLFTCNGGTFGELTAFAQSPATAVHLIEPAGESEQAYFGRVTLPDVYSVKGQIRITGSDRENGFYIDENTYVGVGTVLYLQADSYVLTVQITGIS